MSERIFNFNPGPATMPLEVLRQAALDIVDFQGAGMGLMELSHRSKEFMAVAEQAESLLRSLLAIPDNYRVLFLQGGASSQFFMVPMNFLAPEQTAIYLNTGTWSKKAIAEATKFGPVEIGYTSESENFNRVPAPGDLSTATSTAAYLYLVSNNTIYGTQYHQFPETEFPLVCDMSSDIASRVIDVSQFGLIFAGAQKNLGPAGVTVVIVRDDLLQRCPDTIPAMCNYRSHAEKGSMFNTPPCFAIYLVCEVLKWLERVGGVSAIERQNRRKASILYEVIDSGDYYRGHADPSSRSLMNVVFNLPTGELEAKFIQEAAAQGLHGLKGHRSVGGCRASIYNAFAVEGAEKLAAFMARFAKDNPR